MSIDTISVNGGPEVTIDTFKAAASHVIGAHIPTISSSGGEEYGKQTRRMPVVQAHAANQAGRDV